MTGAAATPRLATKSRINAGWFCNRLSCASVAEWWPPVCGKGPSNDGVLADLIVADQRDLDRRGLFPIDFRFGPIMANTCAKFVG